MRSLPLHACPLQKGAVSRTGCARRLLLALLLIGGLTGRAVPVEAQPTLVADQFADSAVEPEELARFPAGSTPRLCFTAESRLDMRELFCYDGSTLQQITNLGGAGTNGAVRNLAVYDDGGASGTDLYFSAEARGLGDELWRYDGSSVTLVEDINPGSDPSGPTDMIVYDGSLYFGADGGSDGNELWRYNGSGVNQAVDIDGGSSGSFPTNFVVYDGILYFNASGPQGEGDELWQYDGTSATQVQNISSIGESEPNDFAVYDDGGSSGADLYFEADDGNDGRELWRYDGSTVSLVRDLNPGSAGSAPRFLTVYDDGGGAELYFGANDGNDGGELWRYDGSFSQVKDIQFGSTGSRPAYLIVYNGTLYFQANGGTDGDELWSYNGTVNQVADIDTGSDGSNPRFPVLYGGALYFQASGTLDKKELWYYDGTSVQNAQFTNNAGEGVGEKVVYDGTLHFRATSRGEGSELWRSDGTGVQLADDINAGPAGSVPQDLIVYDDGGGPDLYFQANGGTDGDELWRYDGSGATQVRDIRSGSLGSAPSEFAVYDGVLYFQAFDSDGFELWQYDGTVTQVKDIKSGSDGSDPKDLTVFDDGGASGADLYFAAAGPNDGPELWQYDGSTVSNAANIGGAFGSSISGLTVYAGALYFSAYDGSGSGTELWKYTSSGATLAADVNSGFEDSTPKHLTVYDDGGASGADLYFTAKDGSDGRELWRYDGSGATQVADINTGSAGAHPQDLVVFNHQLYFTATNGTDGREPYAYDGSGVTTVDVYPGAFSGGGVQPATFDDGGSSGTDLYVTATDGTAGLELYRFDDATAPLPVELASFEAIQTGESAVRLTWQTASETNNAGFRVQHRRGGTGTGENEGAWTTVGFVEGSGTTTKAQSYRFVAEKLAVGPHQFRLKQQDRDGMTTVHDPVAVELRMREPLRLSAPTPNPVRQRATFSFAVKDATETVLTLYNVLGQEVATLYRGTPAAEKAKTVSFSASNVPSGTYFLHLQSNGQTKTRQLTVVR